MQAGSVAVNTELFPNQWYHVAVTVQRGSASGGNLYVDGVIVETFSMTPLVGDVDNNSRLIIGSRNLFFEPGPFPDVFDGKIDEVEIFNRALSQPEIKSIFDAGSAGKCRAIGGMVGVLAEAESPAEASGSSSVRDYTAPIAGAVAVAAAAVSLAVGGWYARRRWLR